ncbi:DUF1848 domain-containing protein [Caldicellulosiruptor morganii]|uniref:DUF1848 domain-containing protein n=1 Tax=Caldicellulosiruptor morganii TaxID=1387555 RepID=A0ABY7BN23_9FIRM|nr:DUF1848 domain-containing protein [Caldicellulosiruptor morganii]WAM33920.1 DUF1848 domain-containing protein [Caldicellulosiruptor morganii]
MIVSASRRTDIPAFFGDWFVNRIKEGFVMYRNPMRPSQIFAISLAPDDVDAFVFWTKNPAPFIDSIKYLDDYVYYFQFTLNPYDKSFEPGLPEKDVLIETFANLSSMIGKDAVIWRYDPVIITDKMDISYHRENFERLAEKLSAYTKKCVVSYVDFYGKAVPALNKIGAKDLSHDEILEVLYDLSKIAKKYNLEVESCAEEADVSQIGIKKAHCIDGELIKLLRMKKGLETSKEFLKDKNQREACGCVQSIDIGIFNTCRHFCIYCYANHHKGHILNNLKAYDVNSPALCSRVDWENDEVRIRLEKSSFKVEKEDLFSEDSFEKPQELCFWQDQDAEDERKKKLLSKLKKAAMAAKRA